MYNDYYLQQIDTKLNTIIDNQEEIILQNQTLISGDNLINQNLDIVNFGLFHIFIWGLIIGFSLLFYNQFHTMFTHHK